MVESTRNLFAAFGRYRRSNQINVYGVVRPHPYYSMFFNLKMDFEDCSEMLLVLEVDSLGGLGASASKADANSEQSVGFSKTRFRKCLRSNWKYSANLVDSWFPPWPCPESFTLFNRISNYFLLQSLIGFRRSFEWIRIFDYSLIICILSPFPFVLLALKSEEETWQTSHYIILNHF